MRVLVTGGAGYIGSHTTLALLQDGHDVLVVDDLSNSSEESLRRVADLAGREAQFVEANVRDAAALDKAFADFRPDSVIHFAGWKAVGESTQIPLTYYRENIGSTITLVETMAKHGCNRIVFSSSATVYGEESEPPFTEDAPTGATNPYGRTKHMLEQILEDASAANPELSVAILRYFNPIGAHESGRIGEDPKGIPNNLLPFVAQVAAGRREKLMIFGDDYATPDGTGRRDYIHVVDLAAGHLAALNYLGDHTGYHVWNLGTGQPSSVLEIVHAFEAAAGQEIPYEIVARRPGDVAESYANVDKAHNELGWHAEKTVADACADTYRWQHDNPNGFTGL
ncbi:UDP-glucose 4-epimerase GalE [Tessaracoccus sp. MC1865]|uniref:UDP-glucose 4-epimerase GalE n=1 Tax=Tessaracoccus sp. MC1865 TaxID=2760310 RepID=UPI001600C30A|nr:UDP-glucose 4-epimerase GalE [Tessaracoccus sp. MC1865]MBB1482926.1 UDP-glucose 4-epimerase GalE [Tessaracoccus sp. MC1865]QTO37635.1 UDP-glucose 4-epimerase GalE [Tessaracoccus sp. MC1865]